MAAGYFKYTLLLTWLCLIGYSSAWAQDKSIEVVNRELSQSRKKIDSLDRLLIEVLGSRQRVVQEIGVYKKKNNVPPLQPARFKQVVDKAIAAGAKEGLSAEFVTELMNAIHKESLRMEGDTTRH
ncbi:chorismate mutase [Mucilaginibacter sp. 14171R-50]|uniref:chorismate mutase n=1 Tax=Mucilaginibacter sp. 14171R-50 TaxID=2703789 RepID=UPI00138C843B|nr:chorismate mutase [Mucilaginibacter sp. 14171R-50]QHS57672.1 chorismate mutase [Mucilaginibacter sp. 14171R-50]